MKYIHRLTDVPFYLSYMKKSAIQIIRFCVVGTSNALITALVIWIMMDLLSYDYIIANICGYILGVSNSFIWNKLWVFQARHTNVWKEVFLFGVAFFLAYFAQFIFLLILVEFFDLNEYLSQFLGLFIYGGINFVMNRILTFRHQVDA